MLVKAFNRLPMTEGFGEKNESDKNKNKNKKQVLNIGIHYEAFSGMSFLRKEKRQIFNFYDLANGDIVIFKLKK